MEEKYYDLLLVEKMDGSPAIAIAESCEVIGDSIVELANGDLARVFKAAWLGKKSEDLYQLLQSFHGEAFNEVTAIYPLKWRKDTNNGTEPGNS